MDTYDKLKKDWQDLQVTHEELKHLTDCLKKEDFRKLLNEYAQEVNDPDNIKIYENEITELEKERGVDVTFVHPEPGYVIKTSINGDKKCFLNIGKSDIIAKPTSQPSYDQGHRGLQWSIPYSLLPPRDDLDNKNVRCVVFDVVFHPDTIYLASKNTQFRDIVNNTAMDGIESHFKVKLDRKNLRFPKLSVKGTHQPSVIRKPSKEPIRPLDTNDFDSEIQQKLMSSYEEHCRRHNYNKEEEKSQRSPPETTYYKNNNKPLSETNDNPYTVPKFIVKYRNDVEVEDFTNDRNGNINVTVPKKLIIVIDLPLLKNASDASLDVQDRYLTLISEKPAKYKLELPLSYTVDAETGNAKFDTKYKQLTITLPVVRKTPTLNVCTLTESEQLDNDNFTLIDDDTTVPKIIDLNECDNSNFLDNQESPTTFMNPDIKYTLPSYTFSVYDQQFITVINVKNVEPDSIKHKLLNNNIGIHILFTSLGAGLFPMYYSLCLKFDDNSIIPESIKIEPWDNNVILTTKLNDLDNLHHCKIGLDDSFMEIKDLPTTTSFKEQLADLLDEQNQEIVVGDTMIANVPNYPMDSDDEDEPLKNSRTNGKRLNRKHNLEKSRSISESSGDDLPNIFNNSRRPSKGILKTRRIDDFSCSVSESSNDENICPTSSVEMNYESIHDINSESGCSNLKKTVRFNDVISRQLFRSNSSILGQRKKNQRKLNNKKRAHERRMSESETSENEERDKYSTSCTNLLTQDYCDNVKPMFNQLIRMQKQKRSNTVTKNQGKKS